MSGFSVFGSGGSIGLLKKINFCINYLFIFVCKLILIEKEFFYSSKLFIYSFDDNKVKSRVMKISLELVCKDVIYFYFRIFVNCFDYFMVIAYYY